VPNQYPSERTSAAKAPAHGASLLIVSYNFPPQLGGIEQYCVQLARALHRLGVEVHVITKAQPGAASFDAGEPYSVHRYRAADLGLCSVLERLLRQGHDRVLCMQWTSATWLAARRALSGTPRTLAIVALGKELYPSPKSPFPKTLQEAALRRIMRSASHVFAISHFTAQLVSERAPHGNVQLVLPAVDAGSFVPASAQQIDRWRAGRTGPFLLTLARLVPRKGVDTLLRALPALISMHPSLHCFVAGDGPDRTRLTELARELGVEAHVEFLGRIADVDMSALYSASDLFALLSRADSQGTDVEGFGIVLLEAQAAGVPVVTTRAGGMPDALLPDITGILVDAYDHRDFAERAGALLADAPRRRAMSQAAIAHARTQTWQASAERVLDAFARLGAS
jgi:phosphatidylinositol alpha-1,6-mannosyltransferase